MSTVEIEKIRQSPDYEDWIENLVSTASDFDAGTIASYILRLVDPAKAAELLQELQNDHENLLKAFQVLSGTRDAELLAEIRSHEELDGWLSDSVCDLPSAGPAVAELRAIRLLASDKKLKALRNELDLGEGEEHLRLSCERLLDGTETSEDIDAVMAGEHPADKEEVEAEKKELDAEDREALRQLQRELTLKGGARNSRQTRWLAALNKLIDG